MALPVPNKSLLRTSPDAAMLFAHFGCSKPMERWLNMCLALSCWVLLDSKAFPLPDPQLMQPLSTPHKLLINLF